MPILIISTSNSSEDYQADAAVLPNGKILVGPSAISSMADTLKEQIKRYRKIISEDTGKLATGDELLELVAKSYNNMIVQSRVFSDDEIDEAKKFITASRMKNA